MIPITKNIAIRADEVHETFVRASGPGGQNVNKVSSAVQIRFNIDHSTSLPPDLKERLKRLAGNRLTSEGDLLIDARQFRTQERNRQDALERLISLIRRASVPPKKRHATKPTRASKERRLESKKRRGEKKRMRNAPDPRNYR